MNREVRPVVVGVGNVLLGDEGLGVRLVEDLRGEIEAWGAEPIDGGTGGYALLGLVEDRPRVVFVDAARMGLAPGDVSVFGPDAISGGGGAVSGHELDLAATLSILGAVMPGLPVRIVGVEPSEVAPGPDLSPALRTRYREVLRAVREAIRIELTPKEVLS